jgi:predicted nucleic-acid-binding Zn-ribbon protein
MVVLLPCPFENMNEIEHRGFVCPRCSIPMADGWEVLAEGEVHHVTCQFCHTKFEALLVECNACGSDEFVSSLTDIDQESVVCSKCGHHNYRGEVDGGEDSGI